MTPLVQSQQLLSRAENIKLIYGDSISRETSRENLQVSEERNLSQSNVIRRRYLRNRVKGTLTVI